MVGLTTVGMLVHGVDPYCLASRLCLMLRPLAVMGAVGSCVDCLLVSETARALMPHWWMGLEPKMGSQDWCWSTGGKDHVLRWLVFRPLRVPKPVPAHWLAVVQFIPDKLKGEL